MEKICTDSLLELVATPCVGLLRRYGHDVGSQAGSLLDMFRAACLAELSMQLGVNPKPMLIERSLVVASHDELAVSHGRMLVSISIELNCGDPQLVLRTLDGVDLNFGDFSIWLACTACTNIFLNKKNIQMLKNDAKLGDLMTKDGRLRQWPKKKARREDVMKFAAESFDVERTYNEKDVNEIINGFFDDHAMLRRELIIAGMLRRTRNGSEYWRDAPR